MTDEKESTILEEPIIVGVLIAKNHRVIPFKKPDGRVAYRIYGDTEKSLQEIYNNTPLGSLDVIRSIKLARSMIFTMKGGQR